MNARLYFLLATILALATVSLSPIKAAWGTGCAPVGASASYEWRKVPGYPDQRALFRGGVQVAGYNRATGDYRTYDAASRTWGEPECAPWLTDGADCKGGKCKPKKKSEPCSDGCDCDKCAEGCDCNALGRACKSGDCNCVATAKSKKPAQNPNCDCLGECNPCRCKSRDDCTEKEKRKPRAKLAEADRCPCGCCYCGKDCPCAATAAKGDCDLLKNPGVSTEKLGKPSAGETYQLNGKPISPKAAKRLLQPQAEAGPTLPNDAGLLRLTVIGSAAECERVNADLDAFRLRDGLVVQDYPPDHWAVARAGFVTTGHPTVYVQAPDGKVLHYQDVYEGGEQLSEAIRKARDGYDPRKDPNLNAPLGTLGDVPPIAWGTVGGAALLALGMLLKGRAA